MEKVPPRASIILISYNNRSDLQRCLPSLLTSLSAEDEIIIVDNASSDGTPDWIVDTYPQIRLIRSTNNLGFAAGGNLAAHNASGKLLAFINPDTQVDHAWLDQLIAHMQKDSSIGLATPRILMMDSPGIINTCGNETHISGITLCRGIGQLANNFNQPGRVNSISGAAFAIYRDLFNLLGGFDPEMFMYMEDTDLSLRARMAGFYCLFVPSSIVYHQYSLHFGPRKVYYQERNRYRMLLKLFQVKTLVRLIPVWILSEFITWSFVLLREPHRFYNKLLAYGYVIVSLPSIILGHRKQQSLRMISDWQLISECETALDFDQIGSNFVSQIASSFFDPMFGFIYQRLLPIPNTVELEKLAP